MKADACYEHKPNLYHFKKNYLKFMHFFILYIKETIVS
jgi:hypothetical protein